MKLTYFGKLVLTFFVAVSITNIGCAAVLSKSTESKLDHKRISDAELHAAYRAREPQELTKLAESKSEDVLVAIVKNPKTPQVVLERIASGGLSFDPLLSDPDREDDRRLIASFFENPALPGSVISVLDKQFPVSLNIVGDHPNMPLDVLIKKLTRFDDPADDDHWKASDPQYKDYLKVKELSDRPLDALKFMAHSKIDHLREAVALSAFSPPGTLSLLMKDEDKNVRASLARNPMLSPIDMKTLACDSEADVRHALARNVACPRDLLDKLAKDKELYVREGANETLYYIYGVDPVRE